MPIEFVNHASSIEDPLPRNAAGQILKNLLRGTGHASFDPGALS